MRHLLHRLGNPRRQSLAISEPRPFDPINHQPLRQPPQLTGQFHRLGDPEQMTGIMEQTAWQLGSSGIETVDKTRDSARADGIHQDDPLEVPPGFHQADAVAIQWQGYYGRRQTVLQALYHRRPGGVIATQRIADADDQNGRFLSYDQG